MMTPATTNQRVRTAEFETPVVRSIAFVRNVGVKPDVWISPFNARYHTGYLDRLFDIEHGRERMVRVRTGRTEDQQEERDV